MDENIFWLVWCDNRGRLPPVHRHESEHQAEIESRRLADLNPDCKFYVMESKSVSEKVRIQTTRLVCRSIPF